MVSDKVSAEAQRKRLRHVCVIEETAWPDDACRPARDSLCGARRRSMRVVYGFIEGLGAKTGMKRNAVNERALPVT